MAEVAAADEAPRPGRVRRWWRRLRYQGRHRCLDPSTCLVHHYHDWHSADSSGLVGDPVAHMCMRDCSVCGACPTGEHDYQLALRA